MNPKESEKYDLAVIQSALADNFGIRPENLTAISDKGDNSEAFSADLEGQKIIIKTIENDQGIYPVEMLSLEVLLRHGVPVSKPLGYREKVKYLDQPMTIQTEMSGLPMSRLEDSSKLLRLYKEAGEILHKINQIKLKGFGKLEVRDGKLYGKSSSWKNSLLEHNPNGVGYNNVAYLVDHGFINDREAKQIETVFNEVVEVDVPQSAFLHNDFHKHHIFTDGEKITGIIDMGAVSAGDPRFDLAKSHFYLSPEEKVVFDQGYGELSQDPLVTKYFLLVAARKVIYRHSKNFTNRIPYAVERLKQGLAETK